MRGLSATDALFADLKACGIPYQINPNLDRRTRYLFFAFPKALDLARQNQDVVLADCTYNTTKYGLPLLHLVGKFEYSLQNSLQLVFGLNYRLVALFQLKIVCKFQSRLKTSYKILI